MLSRSQQRVGSIFCSTTYPSTPTTVYVDVGVGRESNPILMTIITSDAPFPRSWRIRTTQIECGSISKADTGCLQYFSGVYGRVKSFNFDPIAGLHLSNQDYSVCIRTERNFCGIQYTVCPDLSTYRRCAQLPTITDRCSRTNPPHVVCARLAA